MKKFILPLLLSIITIPCFAQYVVSGRVINKTDDKPIANAVVFLNNSSIANTTDAEGHFTLHAPVGQYHLLVHIVGFENYKASIAVKSNVTLDDIRLTPKIDSLKEVTIREKPKLSPYYQIFLKDFLGTSQFAIDCKILNPLTLQFYDTDLKGDFSVRANDYVQIENDALGYKIKFLLMYFIRNVDKNRVYFNGESYFEEMKGTPAQERKWHRNRLICYQGSAMQLLRSILSDSLAQNGFRIKRASHQANPYYDSFSMMEDAFDDNHLKDWGDATDQLFSDNSQFVNKLVGHSITGKELLLTTNQKGLYAIAGNNGKDTANNSYFIEHIRNSVPVAGRTIANVPWIWPGTVTFFTFKKPYLLFNSDGKMLNPKSVNVDGFMLYQLTVSTMLPFDYKPEL